MYAIVFDNLEQKYFACLASWARLHDLKIIKTAESLREAREIAYKMYKE